MQAMNVPASTQSVAPAFYRVSTEDDVVVALRDLAAQETIVAGDRSVRVAAPIPRGHKVAIRSVSAGHVVRKYGWPIGRATVDIAVGTRRQPRGIRWHRHARE
jgi:altronate hydrolase